MLKKLKHKKIISLLLTISMIICVIPLNQATYVYANEEAVNTIYQEGIVYSISLDDSLNLIVNAEGDNGNKATAEIQSNGNFVFETTTDNQTEYYSGVINELSEESLNAQLKDENGRVVESYTSIEELESYNQYEGQLALPLWPGVVITFGQVLSVLIAGGIIIMIGGVAYIVGSTFRTKINELSAEDKNKAKGLYYKAAIKNSNVFIHNDGMKKDKAATYLKASRYNCVYSFTATMAKSVITAMGYTPYSNKWPDGESHEGGKKSGWYYKHYHPKELKGDRQHSFYGSAIMASEFGTNIG